ncbi:MAG: heparinase [Lentisphaerae bacterium]|jgi:hypothetical protein|nr:heparinase [Lentisphaerota bacterium]MBT4814811.1 heparinase [Lentisphaerota bacterium]MBT5606537.1 heparinase [Lentisphaerota bacterium]MBT7056858.1 heparinase [Lentisphaerota bacterium]MBT7845349.1 heparinase [Lentisphaerota bacterium]
MIQSSHPTLPRTLFLIVCVALGFHAQGQNAPKPTFALADCESSDAWSGGTLDTELRHGGTASIRWDHGRSANLSMRKPPTDWSAYNHLSLWIHSEKATGSRFLLYIGSENPESKGPDYYSRMFTLDFTGWKRYAFFFDNAGKARHPLGWDHITQVRFTASGWGNTPHPEAVVHIDDLVLTKEPPVTGPRLTDHAFFDAIDLERPELAAVATAAKAGDFRAARAAFVRHIKTRETPQWHVDWRTRPGPNERRATYNTAAADRIVAHELTSCGIAHQFGETIDWSINPTKLKYREWTWQLSRHPFWVTLAHAYWATGDETYARDFVHQMTGWVRDNPVPIGTAANGAGSRWRTIETGIRTFSSWPNSFFRFLSSPSFTDDAVITMVKSMVEHAHHLIAHPSRGGNWVCMEMNGLFHVGTLFPEFRDASTWRQFAAERLHRELTAQVYPDGAQIELAPGYHGVSLHNFVGTMRLAQLNDMPLPEDYATNLERMYNYYLKIAMPDRRTPALNDSGWGSVMKALREGYAAFPERKEFQWIATGGRHGTQPDFASCALPYAGWYVMRSGWQKDALYLHFEAGPFGYGHQHEDKLSLIVHAYGKRLLTEGGVYAYDSSQWRRYILSTRSHNTVMIDGLEQKRRGAPRETYVSTAPLPNRWLASDTCDFAEGWYDEGYGEDKKRIATHHRRVLFVKPQYWLVIDRLTPADNAAHRYDALFHLNTADATTDDATGAVLGTTDGQPGLAIVPLTEEARAVEIINGQEEPCVQGWVPGGGKYEMQPIPTPVFTSEAPGPVTMAWMLMPLRPDEALDVASCELAASDAGETAVITFKDGRSHLLLLRNGASKTISTAGATSNAEITLIERRSDGAEQRLVTIE